ncbi:hypothetical protein Cs7R123_37430 [Catellatospora sp. TT07R-123]|nr:hypothetical protein Cs7R123_37430 [Catellatospora sp. TT07R-123]
MQPRPGDAVVPGFLVSGKGLLHQQLGCADPTFKIHPANGSSPVSVLGSPAAGGRFVGAVSGKVLESGFGFQHFPRNCTLPVGRHASRLGRQGAVIWCIVVVLAVSRWCVGGPGLVIAGCGRDLA